MQNLKNAPRAKTLDKGIPCECMIPLSKCERGSKKSGRKPILQDRTLGS